MTPDRGHACVARVLVLSVLAALTLAPPAVAVRLLNYNILNYPGTTAAARNPYFRAVIQPVAPDIVVTQEMLSQAGVDQFLAGVLNTLEPGAWAAAPFTDGNDTDCALFYKTSRFTFLGHWTFYPNPANLLRLVHVYRMRPVGYSSGAAEIRFYSVHLKASTGFETQRGAEAAGMRDSMNAVPPGTHCFALGDFNLYTGTEPALARMIESQADNDGRTYDPLGLQGIAWQDNAAIKWAHTQSPCKGDSGVACASGAAAGGMDDRFDLILPTLNWNDGQGLELIPGTYLPVGNDGYRLNGDIDSPSRPPIPEGLAYAQALKSASDHLPVRVDLQLPALSTAPASIALGDVIGGGAADLAIGNPATPPADALTYSFTAPPGFTAPAGTFHLAAGAADALHSIGTDTGPFGPRAGTLTIATDDPDHPLRSVSLTANVLRHAAASLDSSVASSSAVVDFGTHAAGGFSPQTVAVHNLGWDAAQARLALTAGAIAGGAGRFAITGGFTPALVAGVGQRYEVVFDDAAATADSTYEATLTFAAEDEPLPGAAALAPVEVTLTARVTGLPVGVGGTDRPAATLLYAPYPNPLDGESTVRFDLAHRAAVRLDVFDLSGRRVATLAHREFAPGRYSLAWDGRAGDGARVDPGLYFVHLSGRGLQAQTARIAVVR